MANYNMNEYEVVLDLSGTRTDTKETENVHVVFPIFTFLIDEDKTQLNAQLKVIIDYLAAQHNFSSDFTETHTITLAANDSKVHQVSDDTLNELNIARSKVINSSGIDFVESDFGLGDKMPNLCEWVRSLPKTGDETVVTQDEALTDAFDYIVGRGDNFDVAHAYYVVNFLGGSYLVINSGNISLTQDINQATHFYTTEEAKVWTNPASKIVDVRTIYTDSNNNE